MITDKLSQDYETPDEKLSYSELRDRIRKEVTDALPKKERVMLLAKKLEDDLTIKDTICDQSEIRKIIIIVIVVAFLIITIILHLMLLC